jgi:hypothetical protein
MLHDGRSKMIRAREWGYEMCQRVVAAGIPIVRACTYVGTLHPQVAASAYVWKLGETQAKWISGVHDVEALPNPRRSSPSRSQSYYRKLWI